jgi:hypothetical protein
MDAKLRSGCVVAEGQSGEIGHSGIPTLMISLPVSFLASAICCRTRLTIFSMTGSKMECRSALRRVSSALIEVSKGS